MPPESVATLLAGALLVCGALLIALGAFGLVRLPDVLCRNHAASKALTLGIATMLAGLWIARADTGAGYKIALAIMFQITSIPVAGHLLAMTAHAHKLPRFRPADDRKTRRAPSGQHQ